MADQLLAGDITIYPSEDNGRKAIKWTGSATGTQTLNALYSAIKAWEDDPANMDNDTVMFAVTPDIYRIDNAWFIDDDTVEHLTGGSIFTNGWTDATPAEHVLIIPYSQTTEFSVADIGRTIVGTTTSDTGTLLDFNTARQLAWIRPDVPTAGGDEFDDPDESYSIQEDAWGRVWSNDGGATWTDTTTAANSASSGDWTIFNDGSSGDIAYLGFAQQFSLASFDCAGGTAGTVGDVTWQYWDGSTWTALSGVTDGTAGFTAGTTDDQDLTFTIPSDWERTSVNNSSLLYWIRALVGTAYTIDPIYDQAFVGGIGAGAFTIHNRHGAASSAGESAWAGITTIGTVEQETRPYIAQEGLDEKSGSFFEVKVAATKGTEQWWTEGVTDICLKTMEADSVIGPNPDAVTSGIATVHARQYSKSYSAFIATALSTSGGNTVIPLATADDLNNTTGNRSMDCESGGSDFDTGNGVYVGANWATATKRGIITNVTGTVADPDIEYYLVGDLTDFAPSDAVVEYDLVTQADGDGTATVSAGQPVDFGPALDTSITFTFGNFTRDINNGAGARPYSIDLDPNNVTFARSYERGKHLTRRGETAALNTISGEQYVGAELQVEYTGQSGGAFTEGQKVYDLTSGAEGIVVADHDDGATGDLIVMAVRGTWGVNTVSDSPIANQAVIALIDDNDVFTDVSSEANSAAASTFNFFPASEVVGEDRFLIGAARPFCQLDFNTLNTLGVGGTIAWEYWNGSAWTDIETGFDFVDNTSDLTASGTVTFDAPADWKATTLGDGTAGFFGPNYYIRLRLTGVYSTNPVGEEADALDFTSATIGSLRVITPTFTNPLSGIAGGVLFGTNGLAPVLANIIGTEVQSYQLIDDDGVTQVPPNTVAIEVTNLVSGDTVAVFRRTGSTVDKTDFTVDGTDVVGDFTATINESTTSEYPDAGVIRIVSVSGDEHRYRYTSKTTGVFTLDNTYDGFTADGSGGSTTVLEDTGANFVTNGVEPGDLIYSITQSVFATIVSVDGETTLTTTAIPLSWDSDNYDINSIVENYPNGQDLYVPFIERTADATTESVNIVHSTDIDIRVVVRNAGVILPFSADTSVINTGRSTAAIRSADPIFT